MKTTRRFALVAFFTLAVFLARGLFLRSPKPRPLPLPQPGANLRLCSRVIDGDTIVCEGVGKIRLIGINAPELGSYGGDTSAQFLENLILRKQVKVEVCPVNPTDRYHRTRAIIYLPSPTGDTNVNHFLVSEGYAEVSPLLPCHVDANQWRPLQEEARRNKRGLYAFSPNPFARRPH
jgi:endonuclease YncB( thermonuclease family)